MGKEQQHHPDLMQVSLSVPGLGHCVSCPRPTVSSWFCGNLRNNTGAQNRANIWSILGSLYHSGAWEQAVEPGSKPSTVSIGLVPPAFALVETQPKTLPCSAWSFSDGSGLSIPPRCCWEWGTAPVHPPRLCKYPES